MTTNIKGSRGKEIKKLTLKESIALNRIVTERYAASRMENAEFEQSINSEPDAGVMFRFELNATHIATAIKAADIPSNTSRRSSAADSVGDCLAMTARVQALEEQLAKLTKWFIKEGFK